MQSASEADRVSTQNKGTEDSFQKFIQKYDAENIKSRQNFKKQMRNLKKRLGDLRDRFGKMDEHKVFPTIVKRFNEIGYYFEFESNGGLKIRDKNSQVITEIDIYLENDTIIIVVEVITKPILGDIDKLIQRIEKLKQYRQENDKPSKTLIGAIAGAIFPKEFQEAVLQAGFYVFVQSEGTMKLEIPEDFKPREF
jgi:hypothetical protein